MKDTLEQMDDLLVFLKNRKEQTGRSLIVSRVPKKTINGDLIIRRTMHLFASRLVDVC